jgi:hypothetical protein
LRQAKPYAACEAGRTARRCDILAEEAVETPELSLHLVDLAPGFIDRGPDVKKIAADTVDALASGGQAIELRSDPIESRAGLILGADDEIGPESLGRGGHVISSLRF